MTVTPDAPAAIPVPAHTGDRVLLVDDNPRNLQMLLQFLAGRGHTLLVAKTGEAALEIAAKSRPAVVLLDVMMPGLDGFETCRRLKADPATRDAAVIFLSAAAETEHKLAGFAAGGVDYVTKPIQGDEVVARVDTHLTIRRLATQLQAKIGEIERELTIVQQMQRRLLPPRLPAIDTLDLAAHYSTSRYAGGDYYDVVPVAGVPAAGEVAGDPVPAARWGILVADVSGHGTPAAVTMAMVRTAFHALRDRHDDPGFMLRAVNDHFRYLWDDMGFVTALYGVYDAGRRSVRYACAGHCRPLVWRRATGRAEEAECEAVTPLVIGPLADVPANELALAPGDRVLFYTDGIVERMDAAGGFYGLDRLAAAVCDTAADPPAAAVRRMVESVEAFAAGAESADDQTLLLGAVR